MNDWQKLIVSGEAAEAELSRLRSAYHDSGLYPILLGDSEDWEIISEVFEDNTDVSSADKAIATSLQISVPSWLEMQLAGIENDEGAFPSGDWPTDPSDKMGLITHRDILSGELKKEVIIGLHEISAPWEVFAYLLWGNWNSCPDASEHCAMHRYWEEKYGAEVISVTHDVLQCVVARPPDSKEQALELAREQYLYCPDIVDQGVGTIEALAATLLQGQYWYFWWD